MPCWRSANGLARVAAARRRLDPLLRRLRTESAKIPLRSRTRAGVLRDRVASLHAAWNPIQAFCQHCGGDLRDADDSCAHARAAGASAQAFGNAVSCAPGRDGFRGTPILARTSPKSAGQFCKSHRGSERKQGTKHGTWNTTPAIAARSLKSGCYEMVAPMVASRLGRGIVMSLWERKKCPGVGPFSRSREILAVHCGNQLSARRIDRKNPPA
jgi:hypothetical protein